MGYIVGLLQAIEKTHATVKKKRKLKEKREKQEDGDSIQQDRRRMLGGVECCKAASRFFKRGHGFHGFSRMIVFSFLFWF